MVRFSSLSLLAACVGTALAGSNTEQHVLADPSAQLVTRWTYDDCGHPSDPLQIHSIELSPPEPQPGKDLTVKVSGSATKLVEEGAYANIVVKIGLIKLLTKRFDLCEEARTANTTIQCPVHPGEYTVSHTVALPREIPPAKFVVDVKGYTASEENLLCLNLKVDFSPW